MIIQAQDKGEAAPDVGIKFPPGYLDVLTLAALYFNQEIKSSQGKSAKSKAAKSLKQKHTIFYDD